VYLKKTLIHFTYADLNLSSAPAGKLLQTTEYDRLIQRQLYASCYYY